MIREEESQDRVQERCGVTRLSIQNSKRLSDGERVTAGKVWDKRWPEPAPGKETGIHNSPLCVSVVYLYDFPRFAGQSAFLLEVATLSTHETPYHTGTVVQSR